MATQKSEKIIRGLFDRADIQVNGNNPWDIQVHDKRFYARVLCDAELGVGESYIDGWWPGAVSAVIVLPLDKGPTMGMLGPTKPPVNVFTRIVFGIFITVPPSFCQVGYGPFFRLFTAITIWMRQPCGCTTS